MVELRCWVEAFSQIEFLLEMESHWRLEYTCSLEITGSKEDLVELPSHCSGLFHKYCKKPKIIFHFSVLETKFGFKCCTYFSVVNVGTKIFASESVPGMIYDVDLYKSWFNFTEINKLFCIAGKHIALFIYTSFPLCVLSCFIVAPLLKQSATYLVCHVCSYV